MFALAIAVTTTTFALADSGVLSLPSAPTPAGTASGGVLASFTSIRPSAVSVPQGQGAQVVSGMLLGKVTVAAGFAPRLQIDFSWLDPQNAGAVLNNPNGWVTFGLYQPIHTGLCTGSDPTGAQSITDTNTSTVSQLCVKLNINGAGPLVNSGKLTINATMLSGFILQAASDPSPPATCGATGLTWCAPAGLAINQNVFYVVASVNTPGGIPPGEQPLLTTLNFYFSVRSN